MQLANKTGLVFKISFIIVILLAVVVYKANDHFKSERLISSQSQLRGQVVAAKTSVASQLLQIKNTLSAYQGELSESTINWVQLDPFFSIARVENTQGRLRVLAHVGRSATQAERWNGAFLEKALAVNQAKVNEPVLVQLFKDKAGQKYLVLRFKEATNNEIVLIGNAAYFQKFFDLERGSEGTLLLVTAESMLAAHTEGDYVASQTEELSRLNQRFLFEKEEIAGTNLTVANYILKSKVAAGWVLPWSILGVVLGFGCILVAILYYSLDPLEKKIERYKKQEREQIFKETLGDLVKASPDLKPTAVANSRVNLASLAPAVDHTEPRKEKPRAAVEVAAPIVKVAEPPAVPEPALAAIEEGTVTAFIENPAAAETELEKQINQALKNTQPETADHFIAIEENVDLADIEKALALDDFDSESQELSLVPPDSQLIERNLTPQKVSLSEASPQIESPRIQISRKSFDVDEMKINIRRPEKS
jgi:hypothetical protein